MVVSNLEIIHTLVGCCDSESKLIVALWQARENRLQTYKNMPADGTPLPSVVSGE